MWLAFEINQPSQSNAFKLSTTLPAIPKALTNDSGFKIGTGASGQNLFVVQ